MSHEPSSWLGWDLLGGPWFMEVTVLLLDGPTWSRRAQKLQQQGSSCIYLQYKHISRLWWALSTRRSALLRALCASADDAVSDVLCLLPHGHNRSVGWYRRPRGECTRTAPAPMLIICDVQQVRPHVPGVVWSPSSFSLCCPLASVLSARVRSNCSGSQQWPWTDPI